MVSVDLEFVGDELEQATFDLQNIFSRRNASPVGNAEDMGVHGNGRVSECRIQNDVCGLASHTGKRLEGISILRYLALMSLDEQAAGFDQMFCF